MEPLTITIANARKALGIGNTKIYELINAGRLVTLRIGRRRLVTCASIQQLVEQGGSDRAVNATLKPER